MFPLIIFMFLAPFEFQSEILVYGCVDKSIFILARQSNMAGRGGVLHGTWDGYVPPECRPKPRILRLNPKLMWEEAHEPLHGDIDTRKPCGVGPGMSFANGVLERDPCVGAIGLVLVLLVALASRVGSYFEVVRKAQLEIKLPNVVCVDAKGLEVKKNDTVHLTTSAQVQLGKMLANAFLQIGI
ncbi:unnamed protein product [Fraxinus pennsylvanica]|uniref:Sialate O-acetylesterase domain-containing protein n=1 Tax=Fraxinus pennsylvanica TaxID=56036 RepID=A0AAD2AEY9_9LAMI|nr:unnamed protein product [Fraxinus pennsylvanica]